MDRETCQNKCGARCCKIILLTLKQVRTQQEQDEIHCILAHEGIHMIKEGDQEFLMLESRCKHLRDNNTCRIYDKRYDLCKKFDCLGQYEKFPPFKQGVKDGQTREDIK